MTSFELPPGCLQLPALSEHATDEEIRKAWDFLNRLKEALSGERGKRAQQARLSYREGETRKWKIFEGALGKIPRPDLDEKAGEEKSREVGKELASTRKGLSPDLHRLRALG